MRKRKLLKSVLAGSLITSWTPPVITAISLPAHASMSCNDISSALAGGLQGRCGTDHMAVLFDIALLSSTMTSPLPGGEIFYSGEILNVYSTNPIHEVTWKWPGERNIFIEIRESLPQNCTDADAPSFRLDTLSPGTLFIVTECGTVTIPLGPAV